MGPDQFTCHMVKIEEIKWLGTVHLLQIKMHGSDISTNGMTRRLPKPSFMYNRVTSSPCYSESPIPFLPEYPHAVRLQVSSDSVAVLYALTKLIGFCSHITVTILPLLSKKILFGQFVWTISDARPHAGVPISIDCTS